MVECAGVWFFGAIQTKRKRKDRAGEKYPSKKEKVEVQKICSSVEVYDQGNIS
ncbi:hypothetical protein C900_04568 [Fulvivirga imtechensis AK7]|uniref:Uncharacterized protein n=1 Tax=Fulvivirga imtechensis AK7 TaxID=1237149 RepID=L8JM32_9BACT|nr:hypothetical protein C900_04568 [Fulvivirga imtechensis AK7]